MKELGTPIGAFGPESSVQTSEQTAPGLGWKLSPEAQRDIDAIENNLRMAPHRLRDIVLD